MVTIGGETCSRLRCLLYSNVTYLYVQLQVVFLKMNHQYLVMNRFKIYLNGA